MEKKRAIFLDKDGTLVDSSMYPEVPGHELLKEDILDGLRYAQEKGFALFIVSNQSWISKGKLTHEQAIRTFESVVAQLEEHGIKIADYTFCPHKSEDYCLCRKPRPGMILDLAKRHNIDLASSYMVGDFDEDIESGKNAGVKTILTLTNAQTHYINKPDFIIRNVNELRRIL
ncbi:MAG: HAD-IIIA family hydrolase [Nanoarchaeota archaeon]|nr:HAD-IIIA family hydrolase [Nanoarchaeota archaeon]MBU0977400.1 HAD-IIIA family hydrolase [Nanoarchaeota archaeon]